MNKRIKKIKKVIKKHLQALAENGMIKPKVKVKCKMLWQTMNKGERSKWEYYNVKHAELGKLLREQIDVENKIADYKQHMENPYTEAYYNIEYPCWLKQLPKGELIVNYTFRSVVPLKYVIATIKLKKGKKK